MISMWRMYFQHGDHAATCPMHPLIDKMLSMSTCADITAMQIALLDADREEVSKP